MYYPVAVIAVVAVAFLAALLRVVLSAKLSGPPLRVNEVRPRHWSTGIVRVGSPLFGLLFGLAVCFVITRQLSWVGQLVMILLYAGLVDFIARDAVDRQLNHLFASHRNQIYWMAFYLTGTTIVGWYYLRDLNAGIFRFAFAPIYMTLIMNLARRELSCPSTPNVIFVMYRP